MAWLLKWMKRLGLLVLLLFVIGLIWVFAIYVPGVDRKMNAVTAHAPYPISDTAQALHDRLYIADLHTDSLLWRRDPAKRHARGHVDLPRLREGGVDFQIFSAVTKSPKGQNFDANSADASDRVKRVVMLQLWPMRTWDSPYERAAYQARRLQKLETNPSNKFKIARIASDLDTGKGELVGLLLTEGSHALDGDLTNIEKLHAAGYRAMGLHHFFDNKLGGSMHGQSGAGLSEFGRAAVRDMLARRIIIDVAHSSTQSVRDVLAMTDRPIFISHGGTVSHCPRTANRNLPDDVLIEIAQRGGLLGVGYFDGAICDTTPDGIADALLEAAALLGEDAVALGSDFDGTITATLDTSELAAITQALMDRDTPEPLIAKLMGENARRFFKDNLP